MEIKDFITGKVTYDTFGGQYLWIGDLKEGARMLGQLRGWGAIQNMIKGYVEAAAFQDRLGQFVADAINEKMEREEAKRIAGLQATHDWLTGEEPIDVSAIVASETKPDHQFGCKTFIGTGGDISDKSISEFLDEKAEEPIKEMLRNAIANWYQKEPFDETILDMPVGRDLWNQAVNDPNHFLHPYLPPDAKPIAS